MSSSFVSRGTTIFSLKNSHVAQFDRAAARARSHSPSASRAAKPGVPLARTAEIRRPSVRSRVARATLNNPTTVNMNIWPIALFSLLAATAAHAQVTEVDAGQWHTCALLTGGAVKCWGDNDYGQLGDGTTTKSTTPIDVSGISTATSIALGDSHSCALLTGGAIKCWGSNGNGRLGDRTTTDSTTPSTSLGSTLLRLRPHRRLFLQRQRLSR